MGFWVLINHIEPFIYLPRDHVVTNHKQRWKEISGFCEYCENSLVGNTMKSLLCLDVL